MYVFLLFFHLDKDKAICLVDERKVVRQIDWFFYIEEQERKNRPSGQPARKNEGGPEKSLIAGHFLS